MYRAATWWAMHNGVDLDDPEALASITAQMPLEMTETDGTLQVSVGGKDISRAIRTPDITRQIYRLDHVPGVRAHLVELQRAFGARRPTVAEGRDMGTVVFPNARWKIYLDASVEERVRRRADQLAQSGAGVDTAALKREIEERDHKNMTRAVSPLRRASDARLLDTSELSFDEAVDAVVDIVREGA